MHIDYRCLRGLYALALNALEHTHYVDADAQSELAVAVFVSYIEFDCPGLPLAPELAETMAIQSIESVVATCGSFLPMKH